MNNKDLIDAYISTIEQAASELNAFYAKQMMFYNQKILELKELLNGNPENFN